MKLKTGHFFEVFFLASKCRSSGNLACGKIGISNQKRKDTLFKSTDVETTELPIGGEKVDPSQFTPN